MGGVRGERTTARERSEGSYCGPIDGAAQLFAHEIVGTESWFHFHCLRLRLGYLLLLLVRFCKTLHCCGL